MIRIDAIWLALGASDLRAGMDTLLSRVVREQTGGARIHCAYVFANRGATGLKVLVYDGAGLWLCTRRLQQGRFIWPQGDAGAAALTITQAQWDWLMAGAPWQHLDAQQNITVVWTAPIQGGKSRVTLDLPRLHGQIRDSGSRLYFALN